MLTPVLMWGADGTDDLIAKVSMVRDVRSTEEYSEEGLQIQLDVTGERLQGAKAFRFVIDNAKDDLGTDLLKKGEPAEEEFTELDEYNFQDGHAGITISLKNPLRKAEYVKGLSGTLRLFNPKNDDDAVMLVKSVGEETGSPIKSDKLAKVGVELTILTKEQYEGKDNKKETGDDQKGEEDPGAGLSNAFGSMFGMSDGIDEDSVILKIKDPNSKVIGIEFLDPDGKEMEEKSLMTMNEIRIYGFESKPLAGTEMRVYLLTDKAVTGMPLKLEDIALP
jgi:hypothetical protein